MSFLSNSFFAHKENFSLQIFDDEAMKFLLSCKKLFCSQFSSAIWRSYADINFLLNDFHTFFATDRKWKVKSLWREFKIKTKSLTYSLNNI